MRVMLPAGMDMSYLSLYEQQLQPRQGPIDQKSYSTEQVWRVFEHASFLRLSDAESMII